MAAALTLAPTPVHAADATDAAAGVAGPEEPPVAAAPVPGAAPESTEVVEARAAFRLGSALARQGQWADALAAFRRSAQLRPHPVTTYDIAYCERATGRHAWAYRDFGAALAGGDAALPPGLAALARSFRTELGQRIARVAVTLGPGVTTIQVDGRSLEVVAPEAPRAVYVTAADAGAGATPPRAFDLWLDAGAHVFVVSGTGGVRAVENRALAAGEAATLHLALPASSAGVAATPGGDAGPGPSRLPAVIAFGASGAGLVASGVFAALAVSEKHILDGDPRCVERRCPDESPYLDRERRMRTFSDLAAVGLATGIAAGAAGAILWLTADAGAARQAAGVSPFVGPGSVGVAGRF